MTDNFTWDVIIRLATQGAKGSASDLTQVGAAVDSLSREGKLAEKSVDSLSRGIVSAGRSAGNAAGQNDKYTSSLNSLRYANYDVARSMFAMSTAITAAGVGTVSAFAMQERAFADVRRTAEGSVAGIQQALTDLSTKIPVAFTDLSQIATLGNQLGVASSDIVKFTQVVSSFSTVTGITADASAQAFGRIGNIIGVLPSQYENLASTITYVGRTSAATEPEIISLTERLGATATRAGFTADQVVGLAGALGSLGVAPERAQGVFETYFNSLNSAIADGGKKLEIFAAITGTTTEQLSKMVRTGQGFEVFQRFLSGIQGADTVQLTAGLEALGLSGLRANEVIGRISQRLPLLKKSLNDASSAWKDNTELQRQMAIITETLSAKWTIFLNSLVNLSAALGSSVAPSLGELLGLLTQISKGLTEFAQSDGGQSFFRFAGTVLLVVAAFGALRGAVALATGTVLALQTASRFIGPGLIASVRGLAGALTGVGTGAAEGVGGVNLLRGALIGLGRATLVIGAIQLLTELIFNFGGSMRAIQGPVNAATDIITGFLRTMAQAGRSVAQFLSGIPVIGDAFKQLASIPSGVIDNAFNFGGAYVKGQFNNFVSDVNKASGATDEFTVAAGDNSASLDDLGDNLGNLGDLLGETAVKVRTLKDYSNDLSSVWGRAFDIRFSSSSTLDAITKTFQDMRDATDEAARSIQKLQSDLQGLQSDLNIQQYFLGIATNYGDSKRAEAISAKIADLQSQIADKTAELNKQQTANSKELTGNTAAAITNRDAIRGLVQQYQDHIAALASSGLTQDQLAIATEQLRQDFISQATQLGYNRDELSLYEQSFRDVTVAIQNVPRDITVTANVDPALQALNEFIAQAQANAARGGSDAGSDFANAFNDALGSGLDAAANVARTGAAVIASVLNSPLSRADGGSGKRFGVGGSFAGGGYTGPGGKFQPAGVVHRGEYVIPKRDVNQRTGLPFADALGRLQRGARGRSGYSGGGYVSPPTTPGRMVVDLSALSIQQIGMVMDKVISVGGEVIGATASKQYAKETALGAW